MTCGHSAQRIVANWQSTTLAGHALQGAEAAEWAILLAVHPFVDLRRNLLKLSFETRAQEVVRAAPRLVAGTQ